MSNCNLFLTAMACALLIMMMTKGDPETGEDVNESVRFVRFTIANIYPVA